MNLKLGTEEDFPEILRMIKEFHSESPYRGMAFNEEKVIQILRDIQKNPTDGLVLLSQNNDALLIATVFSPIFSGERMATELVFWVDPQARGTSLSRELLGAYQYWAEKVGCTLIQMGALETEQLKVIDRYYKRNGFSPFEHVYLKEI